MTGAAGSGHPGGSLSATDIITALYFNFMRHEPSNPEWEDRDRFILSKGHASPVLYSALAHAGYLPKPREELTNSEYSPIKELINFRKLGHPLQGHPDRRRMFGVDASTGSLGQGLSIGIGTALAARLDGKDYHTYVMMSDGETNEGQIWEAAMFAAFHKVDNLTAILDRNKFQLDDATKVILDMEPVPDKWKSFNWAVKEIDGHDYEQIISALEWVKEVKGKPSIIIAHTIKGKGVSFMENNNHFHGVAPSTEEVEMALKELDEILEITSIK